MRFFFWNQIQEVRSSTKYSLHYALDRYGIIKNGQLDQDIFEQRLDTIVNKEIPIFIYHEVGEMLQQTFDSETLKRSSRHFPILQ